MTPEEIKQLEDLRKQVKALEIKLAQIKDINSKQQLVDWPTTSLRVKKLEIVSKGNSLYGIRSDDGYYVGVDTPVNIITSGKVLWNINSVAQTLIPNGTTGTWDLGSAAKQWKNIYTTKYNGSTPLAGTKVYYVADSSGGAVTRKLTFVDGILTAET